MSEAWHRRHVDIEWDGEPPSIHSTAVVHPDAVLGADVVVGAFSVVGADVTVGSQTTVGNHVVLKNGTRVGQRVEIADYACTTGLCYIGDDAAVRTRATISRAVIVENRAFVGAGVMTSHTRRVYRFRPAMEKAQYLTRIGVGAVIGSSVNMVAGVQIGANVVVGYASNVVSDLLGAGIYFGNPAKRRKDLPEDMVVEVPSGWAPHVFSEEELVRYLPHCRFEDER